MAGIKGKSGRKSGSEEFKDNCILTMTISWLIENFYKFTPEEKMKVALAIVPRSIVQKVEANVNFTAKTILDAVAQASTQSNRIANHG